MVFYSKSSPYILHHRNTRRMTIITAPWSKPIIIIHSRAISLQQLDNAQETISELARIKRRETTVFQYLFLVALIVYQLSLPGGASAARERQTSPSIKIDVRGFQLHHITTILLGEAIQFCVL
jgi:hypothetical protein